MTVLASGALRPVGCFLAATLACMEPSHGPAADEIDPAERSGPRQIAITGMINDTAGADFRLNYGDGEITVEMAGWEWYREADAAEHPLLKVGERVTVSGSVDEAFYRARRLRAQTVYVEDRDTFYTNSWSRTGGSAWSIRPMPVAPAYGDDPVSVSLAGRVAAVDDKQLSLDLGSSVIRVGVVSMRDDPLDDIGNRRIQVGDWIQVGGELDDTFFRDRRLEAHRMTRIVGDETDAF